MTPTAPTKARSTRELLLQDLARGTSDLPALAQGAAEALRLAQNPAVDFAAVAAVAEADPPLAARLLSVANSAVYGGRTPLSSVKRALDRLGLQTTRDVLYQAAYASMLVKVPRYRALVEASFHHGVRTAKLSRALAKERGLDEDVAFLSGLLHDVGRPRCWKLVATRAAAEKDDPDALAAVDELHGRAGGELAAAWRLPPEVIDVCHAHHQPEGRAFPLLIGAADALAHHLETRGSSDEARAALTAAGLAADRLEWLVSKIQLTSP